MKKTLINLRIRKFYQKPDYKIEKITASFFNFDNLFQETNQFNLLAGAKSVEQY